MKIGIYGTGYVGSVTGACLAEKGNIVTCMDIDGDKIERMQNGEVPIYEPGLEALFKENIAAGRLSFTTDVAVAAEDADINFLAVPTPQNEVDGSADLTYMLAAAKTLGAVITADTIVVNKSTVPVGSSLWVSEMLAEVSTVKVPVVSNPETLREGNAVRDFMYPDQIIIGSESEPALDTMEELYTPFVRQEPARISRMDPHSAEMVKYALNGFLALKVTFVNELAELCKRLGANYDAVREAIGKDPRIGERFLFPGPGWGGSCWPKDTRAFVHMASNQGVDLSTIKVAIESNERRKLVTPQKVRNFFEGSLEGKRIALWGLAFKDKTDDIRESPAITIVQELTRGGALVAAFDYQAMPRVQQLFGDNCRLKMASNEYEALNDADALVIATNWEEFSNPDFKEIKQRMKNPVVFDSRDIWNPAAMMRRGFYYNSMGRATVDGRNAA